MNLAVVNEAVTEMNGVEHQFTEEEKNFVVQFAFRSGSKEDTISLIEALAHSQCCQCSGFPGGSGSYAPLAPTRSCRQPRKPPYPRCQSS